MNPMFTALLAAAGNSNNGAAASFVGMFGVSGYCEDIAVDNNGNLYLLLRHSQAYVAKYNKSGVLQWQVLIDQVAAASMFAIAVDASGNVYVGGSSGYICKFNSAGSMVLSTQVNYAGSYPVNIRDLALDGNGDVYICGTFLTSYGSVIKLSSSLAFVWGRYHYGGSPVGISVANVGTGAVWVVDGNAANVSKLDTGTGAPFSSLANYTATTGTGIYNDASGNAYVCGSLYEGLYVFKLNDSNTAALWGKKLTDFTNYITAQAVSCDTSGNVYAVGRGPAGGTNSIISAKYNSSGTVQWQRRLYVSGSGAGYGASAIIDGFLYSGGYINATSGNGALFGKLPANGTKTGSYTVNGNPVTYDIMSLAEQSTTPSVSTTTQYANGLAFNATTQALTASTSIYPSYVTSV